MHRSNITHTKNQETTKKPKAINQEHIKMVLYHTVPEFLALQDVLSFRISVGKEEVTCLASNGNENAHIIVLSAYYRANNKIFIDEDKKTQPLSINSQRQLAKAMRPLNHAIWQTSNRSRNTLKLLTNVSKIKINLGRCPHQKVLPLQMAPQLTNLTEVVLNDAQIDPESIAYLQNLTKLNHLNLGWCRFDNNSDQTLGTITQLTTLKIYKPTYDTETEYVSVEYLTKLTQLGKLELDSDRYKSYDHTKFIESIGTLNNLKKLSLNNNELEFSNHNINNLSLLSDLSELELTDCIPLTTIYFADLTSLKKLESLNINNEEDWFYKISLAPLTTLTRLKSLYLDGGIDHDHPHHINNCLIADIAKMTGLTALSLWCFEDYLDFHCLDYFKGLKQLESLTLDTHDNSEAMEDNFLKKLPASIKTLKLCTMNNSILDGLYGHRSLTCLDLDTCVDLKQLDPTTDLDSFICATPNLVSIEGLYGSKELAKRREVLSARGEVNVATRS